jgi:hypothetical protein
VYGAADEDHAERCGDSDRSKDPEQHGLVRRRIAGRGKQVHSRH